ncbi:hypothetical protein GCM10020229_26630 [Kitasatospora albolonga]
MNPVLTPTPSTSLIRREVAGYRSTTPAPTRTKVAGPHRLRPRHQTPSNNETRFGVSPAVSRAVRKALADGVSRYPDPTGGVSPKPSEEFWTFRPPDRVVARNGSRTSGAALPCRPRPWG